MNPSIKTTIAVVAGAAWLSSISGDSFSRLSTPHRPSVAPVHIEPEHPTTINTTPPPAKLVLVDIEGTKVWAEDPSFGPKVPPCKPPKMPLRPLAIGPLTGWVIILDPGHGGTDKGMSWVVTTPDGRKVIHYESAYTYAMTLQIADQLRRKGAVVYLTAYSALSAQAIDSKMWTLDTVLPMPRDAVFLWNPKQGVTAGKGWHCRTDYGNAIWKAWYKKGHVLYAAIHVDSLPGSGWHGSHVVVKDWHAPPPAAQKLADFLKYANNGKYVRAKDGVLRPLLESTRKLFLFAHSVVPNSFIWETALPQNEEDSQRIRDKEACGKYTEEIFVAALVKYASL